MAKGRAVAAKGRQGKIQHPKGRKGVQDEMPSDDEIQKFHRSRDKLSLDPANDSASEGGEESEDDLEEAVYNLSDDVGAESDEEDSDEDEDGRLAEREPCFYHRTPAASMLLQPPLC
jgi:hypothetical protein